MALCILPVLRHFLLRSQQNGKWVDLPSSGETCFNSLDCVLCVPLETGGPFMLLLLSIWALNSFISPPLSLTHDPSAVLILPVAAGFSSMHLPFTPPPPPPPTHTYWHLQACFSTRLVCVSVCVCARAHDMNTSFVMLSLSHTHIIHHTVTHTGTRFTNTKRAIFFLFVFIIIPRQVSKFNIHIYSI